MLSWQCITQLLKVRRQSLKNKKLSFWNVKAAQQLSDLKMVQEVALTLGPMAKMKENKRNELVREVGL